MLAIGKSREIGAVEVIFRTPGIRLCSSGGEESRNCDLRIGAQAIHDAIVVANQKPGLVQPVRRDLVEITDIDFMFEKMRVGCRAGQDRASDSLVLRRAMLVGIANPELVAIGEIVKDTSRAEEVMRGIGNALSESAEAQRFGCRERGRIDDCLLIEQIVIESQQEAAAFAVAQWPCH